VWQFDSEVSRVVRQTPDIKTFRFPIYAKGVRYLPGQFFFLTIKVGGQDAIHHFSFSSSPTEKGYIEFTKRITGSDFSQALDAMKPGTRARLQGPVGFFTLPRKQRNLAFLSGGIGITPLRSMLRYIADKGLDYDIVMLYGNKIYADIPFREELDAIAASHPNLHLENVLSGPDLPAGWKGKTGLITGDMVREVIPDYKERRFYISGPPRMVISLEAQIQGLGIPPKQVRRDSFTGYD
jgi:ferredoxin-NADP reductase